MNAIDQLPALSPELTQHAYHVRNTLVAMECVQARWSTFAINGLFKAFLDEHKDSLNGSIVVVDATLELRLVEEPDKPEDLNIHRGQTVIGCSLYQEPHGTIGNILMILRDDPTIPRQKPHPGKIL